MKNKLDELRKNLFLEIGSKGMLGSIPGESIIIITKNKKMYHYKNEFDIRSIDINNIENLSGPIKVENELFVELDNYINKNLIGKEFEPVNSRDGLCYVKGEGFSINNYFDINSDLKKIIKKYKNK